MPLELGIVGPPNSGKTTLFNALTGAHADVTAYAHGEGNPNVGVASIPDERLAQVAAVTGAERTTPATIRVLDVPGLGRAALGELRHADALIAVTDAFSPKAEPARDLESVRLELQVADRDHVERRLEHVRRQAKSGSAELRRELERLERLLVHVDSGASLAEWPEELPGELQPLTTKPLLPHENGPAGIDCKLEAELVDLPEDEAAAFRDGPSALADILRRLADELGVITFFTANENEARALSLRRGQTALDAAAAVHTDIAHGFVRAEVVRWNDLVESGSRADAARRGLQRLEGKTYVVEDGDVLQIRFTPPARR